jgi:hypothetical protein
MSSEITIPDAEPPVGSMVAGGKKIFEGSPEWTSKIATLTSHTARLISKDDVMSDCGFSAEEWEALKTNAVVRTAVRLETFRRQQSYLTPRAKAKQIVDEDVMDFLQATIKNPLESTKNRLDAARLAD